MDERSGLPRHKEFLDNKAADSIEREHQGLGITQEEKEFVELRYGDVPGAKRAKVPDRLKPAAETIEQFPTPVPVIREVSDAKLKDMLRRWYREYSYFSGYSHAGFRKLMPRYMDANMKLTTTQKEKVFGTEYVQAVMISYLATVVACTEAGCRDLPRSTVGGAVRKVADIELIVKLSELWDTMKRSSLIGRALYEMRARDLLPPAIRNP